MNAVRKAIKTLLAADATLMTMLTSTSILNEAEFTGATPVPAIALQDAGGGKMNDPAFYEDWDIVVFDRNNAYYNIELIKERVRQILDRKSLALSSTTIACYEAFWIRSIPSGFSRAAHAEYEGDQYRIYLAKLG